MGYNLPINGIYWGYNPLTNHLLTSWDIQVALKSISTHGPRAENFIAKRVSGIEIFTWTYIVYLKKSIQKLNEKYTMSSQTLKDVFIISY